MPHGWSSAQISNSKLIPGDLPFDHHGDYRISPITFILSEPVATYENMPYGWSLIEMGNSKYHPGGCFSTKMKQICLCSRYCNMDGFFWNLTCRLVWGTT
jgi:hypothetical protein